MIDTLRMAKALYPGKRNNLDALCERYQVNNATRTLHGALLDAQLLAEVYLSMTRGQESLIMEVEQAPAATAAEALTRASLDLVVIRVSDEELARHEQQLTEIAKISGGKCLWTRIGAPEA